MWPRRSRVQDSPRCVIPVPQRLCGYPRLELSVCIVQRTLPQGCLDITTPCVCLQAFSSHISLWGISWWTFPSHPDLCLLQGEVPGDTNLEMLESGQRQAGPGAGGVPWVWMESCWVVRGHQAVSHPEGLREEGRA